MNWCHPRADGLLYQQAHKAAIIWCWDWFSPPVFNWAPTIVQPQDLALRSLKKKNPNDKCLSLSERCQSDAPYYRIQILGHCGKGKTVERIKRPVVARGWGRRERAGRRGFLGHDDFIMMDICHHIFVQTHKRYNTKSEPGGELWTWGDYDVSM